MSKSVDRLIEGNQRSNDLHHQALLKIIFEKDNIIKELEEQLNNIEEKAFWAAKCGLKTLVTDGKGFFTNDIAIVNTIEEYRNHPNYQYYIDKPYPDDELVIKMKDEYFQKNNTL